MRRCRHGTAVDGASHLVVPPHRAGAGGECRTPVHRRSWLGLTPPPAPGSNPPSSLAICSRGRWRCQRTSRRPPTDRASHSRRPRADCLLLEKSRTSKEIGTGQLWGRVSGFPSSARTIEWAVGEFRKAPNRGCPRAANRAGSRRRSGCNTAARGHPRFGLCGTRRGHHSIVRALDGKSPKPGPGATGADFLRRAALFEKETIRSKSSTMACPGGWVTPARPGASPPAAAANRQR